MDLETAQTTTTAKLPILKQENGNSFKPAAQTTTNVDGNSTTLIPGLITTEEKYKDAKTLFAAIQTRFGGNEATKKTQKTLLKQMYKNFSAPSTESLDFIFNRLQKIVSQLAILGINDLDTMSFDDLYNNFKIVEQEVKGTASSSSSSSSQNMAFVSSPSSTNEVNTAYGVSTANTQVSPASTQVSTASTQDLEQIHEDDLEEMDLKWQLALLSMRTRRFFQKTSRNITINGSDTAGYDKSKVECFNCHKMGHFTRECRGPRNQDSRNKNQGGEKNQKGSRRTINVEETSSKAMVAIDGAGFDWSYMVDDEVPRNMDLMAFSESEPDLSNSGLEEFQQLEFEGYGPKTSKSVNEDIYNKVRESPDALLVEELVLDDKLEKKTVFLTVAKIEFVTAITIKVKGWNIVPRAVLMKTGLRPLNTARPVNTAHPKTTVYSARPMSCFSKSAQSTVKRPYQIRTTLTNKNFSQKVNTAKGKFYTARPNLAVVNVVRANQGHPQKEDQGYVDSGCSRHMTGNMSYLSDFKEFDGGYVTFRGGAKGGKITGKGTLKTGKLDFEDVYFVKELQFNLFSVSQMCDKKNSVLFTDTGCFVLSPDFKLADESQVLLKVPRKNNMYSVDMKNIVPKESLTCLVAKATLDESMLWHRRLGHVNFKTINKLVKENLERGLPIKRFENDQTCVACLKGKQHKAFCRTPTLSFMRPFGCHDTILNTLDYLGKFDGKFDEGFFVGYSLNSDGLKWLFDIDVLTKSMNYVPVVAGINSNDFVDGLLFDSSSKNASNDGTTTSSDVERRLMRWSNGSQTEPDMFSLGDNATLEATHADFFGDETEVDMSNITTTYLVPSTPNTRIHKDHSLDHVIGDVQSGEEPKRIAKALSDSAWVEAMQEELLQFKLQKVWVLVDLPKEQCKAGCTMTTQEEGIDYDEVFAPVARIEAIRLFLAYASFMGFMVYQMDMKSDFLYGRIEKRGKIDQTLFIKKQKGDILLVQVYVYDIIFGSTKKELCTEFEKPNAQVSDEFYERTHFLLRVASEAERRWDIYQSG
ncbi:ribonuclease H-like domain-containing protein [Tanacetum coccineum]